MQLQAKINHKGKVYFANLQEPLEIALALKAGDENPNCYFAEDLKIETINFGDTFVGSVALGGSCNYQTIRFTPHGNGTHTECYGHISAEKWTMFDALKEFFFVTHLITITPEKRENGDNVITLAQIKLFESIFPIDALVIRTLPNDDEKMKKKYSNTNPPYFEPEVGLYLREKGVKHLLCDLPSVDKESDEGKLAMHKYFWDYPQNIRKNATITELVFVPNDIHDGLYLLNLQTPTLDADAVPSRPVLFLLTNN